MPACGRKTMIMGHVGDDLEGIPPGQPLIPGHPRSRQPATTAPACGQHSRRSRQICTCSPERHPAIALEDIGILLPLAGQGLDVGSARCCIAESKPKDLPALPPQLQGALTRAAILGGIALSILSFRLEPEKAADPLGPSLGRQPLWPGEGFADEPASEPERYSGSPERPRLPGSTGFNVLETYSICSAGDQAKRESDSTILPIATEGVIERSSMPKRRAGGRPVDRDCKSCRPGPPR